MAINRDNAEIVAKEIQISLNLFERAEHVLKNEAESNLARGALKRIAQISSRHLDTQMRMHSRVNVV